MKKKLLALGLAVMTVAMSLVGCSEKAVTWTVTCPWAPSGVAAMVSQKAASLSNTPASYFTVFLISGKRKSPDVRSSSLFHVQNV